ncbi:5'-methylthioadenosine/S-adenosylhomocysteine nucleosidase family protein [Aspergillus puulaauensis]|uniref:Nucleoside phosphorylase domain-containing protein n=1 Tax=Aspergillus puulaauensis TaxID=1220207 RepID=A0A7R7XU61_9EURO|nr:uncharacterized protein APUU_60844A [Aspergillus puulaauensis]BCS27796.1 hypothetical protein APUU_60844A [Aspergillus puulaauensis]
MAIIVAGLLLLFAVLVLDALSRRLKESHLNSWGSTDLPHDNINAAEPGRYPMRLGATLSGGRAFCSLVPRPLAYKDYTVGWICALPIEMAAAKAMLDELHADLPANPSDENTYILGRICSHNVVVACLPTGIIGPTPAATVATQMLSTFRSIRFNLMVGIGGGIPGQADIRLGDVVVAKPTRDHGGGVQYDYPTTVKECTIKRTGMFSKPPRILLTALSKLQATHLLTGPRILSFLSEIESKYPLLASTLRPQGQDSLVRSKYHSRPPSIPIYRTCHKPQPQNSSDTHRERNAPKVHYGLIASGNQVIKDSRIRDHLARESNILCFEMEAAGLLDTFPCLVIRGVSDYADCNKNDAWQGYAAATAAAYAKELLSVIPRQQVEDAPLAVRDFQG